jgi:hypothetical protein
MVSVSGDRAPVSDLGKRAKLRAGSDTLRLSILITREGGKV